jgi:hypothetical protein
MRIGTCEELRSARAKSMPDSCGIITSRMSRSKARLRMQARALAASIAVLTRKPCSCR